MRLIIDSQIALWIFSDSARLGPEARRLLVEFEVLFSAATPWELGMKRVKGKLGFVSSFGEQLGKYGFAELPISVAHAEKQELLPAHHHDHFDRIIIAQAIVEGLVVLSSDRMFSAYPVDLIDSSE